MPDPCLISSVGGGCQATAGGLWRSMGWITRADVTLLALMLAYEVAITSGRLYRFAITRRHSRLFVRNAASVLEGGGINRALALAKRYARGHVASTVAAGLIAFAQAPPHLTHAEAVEAAERAFQRTRKRVVTDLKQGAGTLTSIALCAPLVGLIGTIFGIMGAFVWANGLHGLPGGLAEALVTTALGLLVAIPAAWGRNYILISVEAFETEMSNSTLETITYCATHRRLRFLFEHAGAGKAHYASVFDDTSGTRSWEIPYDRPRGLLLLISFYTLFFLFFFLAAALAEVLGAR